MRAVSLGDAQAIVAGGAEAISMAPWRVAKPRNLQQLPRFLSYEPGSGEEREGPAHIESAEALAIKHGIGRAEQDAYALRSYLKAEQAREHKRFVGEIAPLRANPDEARDQSSVAPDFKDLAQLAPYMPPDGTLTPGNTASLHDGAAVAVVVSKNMWTSLGKPRGLRLLAHAARGTAPDDEAAAPIEAMQKLRAKFDGYKPSDIGIIEMSEVFRRAGNCAYPQPRNRRGPSQPGRRRHRSWTSVRGVELRSGYASFHAHGARRRRESQARRGNAGRRRRHGSRGIVRSRLTTSAFALSKGRTRHRRVTLAFVASHTQLRQDCALDFPVHSASKTRQSAWDRRNPAPKWTGAVVIVHRGVTFEPLGRCGVLNPASAG